MLNAIALQDVPQLYSELFNPAHYSYDPRSLWNFAAALVAGVSGYLIVRWERGTRASQLFAIFTFLFLLWASGRGLMRLLIEPDLVLFVARRIYVCIVLAVIVLYHFMTIMLRTESRRLVFLRLNWGIALVIAVASFASEAVLGGVVEYSWGYEPTYGPIGFASVVWIVGLMAAASFDTVRSLREAAPDSTERRRVAGFGIALLVLCTGFVEFLPTMGYSVYPTAFISVSLFTAITGYLTHRFGLIEFTPQVVAQQIAELMRGALLILDPEGVIQYASRRSHSVFGLSDRDLLGRRARRILGEAFEPASLGALVHADERDLEKEWTYANPATGSRRELALSAVEVHDRRQRDVATVCIVRDVTARSRARQDRENASLHDPLTGLPNRAMFVGLLDATVQRSREASGYTYGICFVALDRLRVINDDLGTAAGDRVLTEISARLRRAARPQDTVARVGGDEFGVLLRGHSGEAEVRDMSERLLAAVRVPMKMEDHELFLSASIGVTVGDASPANGAELLRRASMAMYQVKQDGGGALKFAAASGAVGQRTRLESEIRHALDHDEFQVYYQPVVDLKLQRVSGFEALVRWAHPRRGLLLPADFLEFAEEAGLQGAIDAIVLARACTDLREMQSALGCPELNVSVNLGDEQMRDPRLADRIRDRLLETGLRPESLRIELLERVALIDPLRATLDRLRAMGLGLYVDDFGTGYSALSRLHDLPVTAVKIDREFVRGMSLGSGGERTIRSILALSRSLGLAAIAEGCATATEVRRLYEMGCRQVQGFYFSAALPLEAALQLAGDPELLQAKFRKLGLMPPEQGNSGTP